MGINANAFTANRSFQGIFQFPPFPVLLSPRSFALEPTARTADPIFWPLLVPNTIPNNTYSKGTLPRDIAGSPLFNFSASLPCGGSRFPSAAHCPDTCTVLDGVDRGRSVYSGLPYWLIPIYCLWRRSGPKTCYGHEYVSMWRWSCVDVGLCPDSMYVMGLWYVFIRKKLSCPVVL